MIGANYVWILKLFKNTKNKKMNRKSLVFFLNSTNTRILSYDILTNNKK